MPPKSENQKNVRARDASQDIQHFLNHMTHERLLHAYFLLLLFSEKLDDE